MTNPIPPQSTPPAKKKWTLYKKWQIFAPTGLILTGLGLCLFGSANAMMRDDAPFIRWFLAGTLSLVTFNTGLVLFGEAVRCRTLYDMRKVYGDRKKKRRPKHRQPPNKINRRPEP